MTTFQKQLGIAMIGFIFGAVVMTIALSIQYAMRPMKVMYVNVPVWPDVIYTPSI